jgi:hypothetical protein
VSETHLLGHPPDPILHCSITNNGNPVCVFLTTPPKSGNVAIRRTKKQAEEIGDSDPNNVMNLGKSHHAPATLTHM